MSNTRGLTEKQKNFCREYIANQGNGTEAYISVYNTKNRQIAMNESSLLLKRKDINDYLKQLSIPLENKAISERQKKRTILWSMIENPNTKDTDKCRAMDILNKMDLEYKTIIEEKSIDLSDLSTDEIKDMLK